MFHTIPENVQKRMRELEAIDSRDRHDGTPRSQRLRQIPPETGRFISLLALCAPPGRWLEIGTSAAYSALWLGLAARHVRRTLTTFETSETKVDLARKTLAIAQLQDTVELVHGDARVDAMVVPIGKGLLVCRRL